MTAIPMPAWCKYLKIFNIITTCLVAVLILLSIWFENIAPDDFIAKIIASYLTVLIASAIVYKINAPSKNSPNQDKNSDQ